jgi:hypothetical protein
MLAYPAPQPLSSLHCIALYSTPGYSAATTRRIKGIARLAPSSLFSRAVGHSSTYPNSQLPASRHTLASQRALKKERTRTNPDPHAPFAHVLGHLPHRAPTVLIHPLTTARHNGRQRLLRLDRPTATTPPRRRTPPPRPWKPLNTVRIPRRIALRRQKPVRIPAYTQLVTSPPHGLR